MVSAIKNVLVAEKVVIIVNTLLFHLLFPLVQWESAAVPRVTAIPKPISSKKNCCFRLRKSRIKNHNPTKKELRRGATLILPLAFKVMPEPTELLMPLLSPELAWQLSLVLWL
jgi:hypothetical protein